MCRIVFFPLSVCVMLAPFSFHRALFRYSDCSDPCGQNPARRSKKRWLTIIALLGINFQKQSQLPPFFYFLLKRGPFQLDKIAPFIAVSSSRVEWKLLALGYLFFSVHKRLALLKGFHFISLCQSVWLNETEYPSSWNFFFVVFLCPFAAIRLL